MKCIVVIMTFTIAISSIFGFWDPVWSQTNNHSKPTLGVLPFNHAGVEEYEAFSLSNRLHSELVKTRRFRVVETERVNDILKEMVIPQTGACTNTECVVQVGNMLGAKFMVTGSIGKVGRTCTVDVRIFNVETRRVVYARTNDTQGKIDELLVFMCEIAHEIAGSKKSGSCIHTRSSKWLWILGSTAIIGGGIAAYLFTQQTEENEPIQVIGTPPDPPRNP